MTVAQLTAQQQFDRDQLPTPPRVALSWGWTGSDSTIPRVMTHAVDAGGRVMHDNYGPVIWSGTRREQHWCRVLKLAEEFRISANFEPFTLCWSGAGADPEPCRARP